MQIKTSTALAIFAIVMAIALVTAGSLTTSAFAAKTKKHTSTRGTSTGSTSTLGTTGKSRTSSTSTGKSSTSTGLSKFISCVKALPTLTRADAVNCYNTVFNPGFSSGGSTAGSGTGIGSGTGSSGGSTAGSGTLPG